MDSTCYEIVRDNDKWTICACGMRLIVCRDRRTAMCTARRATVLLAPDARGAEVGKFDTPHAKPS